MRWSVVREYGALFALSSSGGLALLIPLYLSHEGYPVGMVGLMVGLGGVATLLSQIPVPMVYRPQRSIFLLVLLAGVGAATAAAMAALPGILWFALTLVVNRAAAGAVTAIYLARFLDTMGEGANRRRAMGYYGGTQAAGYATANLVTGLLADFVGYGAAFLYGAALFALAGVLLLGASTGVVRPRQALSAHAMTRPLGVRGWLVGVADPGLWGVLNVSTWNNVIHTVQVSFFPVLALSVGLAPTQIGALRALFAGVNAVARPVAGLVMGRFSLRQIGYAGIGSQLALLAALPLLHDFTMLALYSLVAGVGRAVVVVAGSAGLAEEVDETRVSRGVSTAAYSTSMDLPFSVGPLVAGLVATLVGTAVMFPIVAATTLVGFVAGELTLTRWRARRAAEGPSRSGP